MNYSTGSTTIHTTVSNLTTATSQQASGTEQTFIWLHFGNGNTTVETPGQERSYLSSVFLAIVLGVIVILTVIGNVLVIVAIVVNANLRTTTYYFIANLAIADLLLGTTVLPFSATLEVLQYWAFGHAFCDVWAAIDVMCCTASILSLCVISIDRYIGVTRPLQHGRIMCQTRTIYVIVFVWLLSMTISVAPLIGWKEDPNPDPRVCTVTTQPGYVLFSVAGSFYIPCLIILVVYFRIYRETVIYTRCLMSGAKMSRGDDDNVVSLRIHMGRHVKRESQPERYQVIAKDGIVDDYNSSTSQYSSKKSSNRNSRLTFLNKVAKFNREKKAAKTLGIVVGVFIICWLPFFIILPLDSLCTECFVPPLLFKLFFWLGYCNSTVNPIIYTCSSLEFRRAFLGILCCRRCSKRPRIPLTELQMRSKAQNGTRRRAIRQKQQLKEPELHISLCEMPPSSSAPGTCNKVNGKTLSASSLPQVLVSIGNDSESISLDHTDFRNDTKINLCSTYKTDCLCQHALSPTPSKHETSTQTFNDGKSVFHQHFLPVKKISKDQDNLNDTLLSRYQTVYNSTIMSSRAEMPNICQPMSAHHTWNRTFRSDNNDYVSCIAVHK